MIALRRMAPADLPSAVELSGQLGYPTSPATLARRFERLLARPDHALFVAEDVAGWIHVYEALSLESEPWAEIGGLVVDVRRRRSGVGRALVDEAERWARAQGLDLLRARSNVIREEAHRFYPGIGFTLRKTQHAYARNVAPADPLKPS
jgi:ribosomal protein S18 acetylase RimI-like enzyme